MEVGTVEQELAELRDLFQRRLLNDKLQKQMYDELCRQLDQAGEDRARQILTPVLRQVILVLDRIESSPQCGDVDSISSELEELLVRQGVSRMACVGTPFTPSLHQAVRVAEVGDAEHDGIVLRELRGGYHHGDKVLRAAEVEVGRFTPAEEGEPCAGSS
ncbi:nucleotide exchange factor GrpE [Streptomyces sp. ID05-26A]|nr:nucleotide exchange factor GrpE [Streptomyces sp. ID05-26A]